MNPFRISRWLFVLVSLLAASVAGAQTLDGTLRGEVTDPSGAVVAGAMVTATNVATNVTRETTTSESGTFNLPNMLPGIYTVKVESSGFPPYTREQVQVRTNQVTEVNAKLNLPTAAAEVAVTTGAEVVQTDHQLVNTFDANEIVNLPINSSSALGANGILNLAILAPGTTTQGGGVLGQGGSIGGARPRMNNFNVDGLDDNQVDITGSITNVIQDGVQEFTLITNQFSAELGHSAGGQFNVVTKSGTNDFHGTAAIVNNNRKYNAFSNIEKQAQGCYDGPCTKPRSDFNQISGTIGGPVVRDKVFFFGGYQRVFAGFPGTSTTIEAPTSAGLAALNSLTTSAPVKEILAQFPIASTQTRTEAVRNSVTGATATVGLGRTALLAPSFFDEHDIIGNGDVNFAKHQLRGRFLYNQQKQPNLSDPPVPQFSGDQPFDVKKVSFQDVWTVTPRTVNDLRLGVTRLIKGFTVPEQFANFPNVFVDTLQNFQVGPEGNSPQNSVQNVYQLIDGLSHNRGAHTLKFGGEYRKWITPSTFLPRSRGEWEYEDLSNLVSDTVPVTFAKRGAGNGGTDGNQQAFYWYAQDDWKVSPRFTLNLGIRYEWTGTPKMVELQELNAISNCPECTSKLLPEGLIFRKPKSDTNNFAPRLGFSLDPTGSGKWSLRGGFGMSYDVIAQNFPSLELPPQLQSEQDPDITCALPGRPSWCASPTGAGFLAGGGLLSVNVPPATRDDARAATQGYIFDYDQPIVYTWTASVQREIMRNTGLEIRYLGTKGTHLFAQSQLNSQSAFDRGARALPTYFSQAEVPATFAAGSATLAAFNAAAGRPFAAQGFVGAVTGFTSNAESIYHSGSIDVNRRFAQRFSFRANYTWAHNIDTGTNELFSSLVNPRRAEDAYHIENERGNSVLDIRHKAAVSWTYEVPRSFSNAFVKAIAGGWVWNGTYIAQSGQPVTAQSNADANGNGDAAGDRAIVNPNGDKTIGSNVQTVCWTGTVRSFGCATPAQVVGYVATTPGAGYVRAQVGALSTAGRNTLTSPGRSNFDMSFFRSFYFTEQKFLQFRAEFFNIFNHRQFSFANPGVFAIVGIDDSAINAAGYGRVYDPGFLDETQLNGGSRNINFGLKFVF